MGTKIWLRAVLLLFNELYRFVYNILSSLYLHFLYRASIQLQKFPIYPLFDSTQLIHQLYQCVVLDEQNFSCPMPTSLNSSANYHWEGSPLIYHNMSLICESGVDQVFSCLQNLTWDKDIESVTMPNCIGECGFVTVLVIQVKFILPSVMEETIICNTWV